MRSKLGEWLCVTEGLADAIAHTPGNWRLRQSLRLMGVYGRSLDHLARRELGGLPLHQMFVNLPLPTNDLFTWRVSGAYGWRQWAGWVFP